LTNLYGSTHGLGLASDENHEINKQTYIQLDLSNITTNVESGTIPTITIHGIEKNEGYRLFGTNIPGTLGTTIYTSNDENETHTIDIPMFGTYRYISITASGLKSKSSVLLNSLTYMSCIENIPEIKIV
jgi:hypothetical protein